MKTRIKEVRESLVDETGKKLSQAKFAERLGVSMSSAQKWEIGAAIPNNAAIKLIAEKCGINEQWLRTGKGEMKASLSRQEEMSGLVNTLMQDKPESFRTALITTLLRFDPDGPEWEILERIYDSVARDMNQNGNQK